MAYAKAKRGRTPPGIVRMEKDGKKYFVPAKDVEKATKDGFQPVGMVVKPVKAVKAVKPVKTAPTPVTPPPVRSSPDVTTVLCDKRNYEGLSVAQAEMIHRFLGDEILPALKQREVQAKKAALAELVRGMSKAELQALLSEIAVEQAGGGKAKA